MLTYSFQHPCIAVEGTKTQRRGTASPKERCGKTWASRANFRDIVMSHNYKCACGLCLWVTVWRIPFAWLTPDPGHLWDDASTAILGSILRYLLESGGIMLDQSVWSITALTWGMVSLSSQVLTCWEEKLADKHHYNLMNSWRLMDWPTCVLFLRTHGPRALSYQGSPFSPLILSFTHWLFSSFLRKTYTRQRQ